MINKNNKNCKYVLDTNVLIRFAFWCPIKYNSSFWVELEKLLLKREVILLDVVFKEIQTSDKVFKRWLKKQKDGGLITKVDDSVRNKALEINNKYNIIDSETHKSTGDTYIIAYAVLNNLAVFTEESRKRPYHKLNKIPDVCNFLKVNYTRKPVVFMNDLGFKNI